MSLSDESEIKEKIKDMAKLSVLSGRINEIQEKNIKMYPLIMFMGVRSVKIDYDLAHRKTMGHEEFKPDSNISFYLDIDEREDNTKLDKRFKGLEDAVRTIFWRDIIINVYFNNKLVYKSKENVRK